MAFAHHHIDEDLSTLDLKGKDLAGSLFYNCQGTHSDFRGSDLTGCSFAKSDLSYSKFLGAKITLNCYTFEGMKLDRSTVSMFLYLLTLTEMPNDMKENLINIIGAPSFNKLKNFFDNTEP